MVLGLFKPTPTQVVERHGPDVLRHLKRMFGPGADVDDLFQIVMVEVLRSLPSFSGRSKLGTWIRRITLNVAYQHMRRQYREREVMQDFDPGELCDDRELARTEARAMLYSALSTLPPKKRLAVLMHDIEGHTLKECARLLERPLQTVASQVKSGRTQIAKYFDGRGDRGLTREVSEK